MTNRFRDPVFRREYEAALYQWRIKHRNFFLPDGSRRTQSSTFNQFFWAGYDGKKEGMYRFNGDGKRRVCYAYYRAGEDAKKEFDSQNKQ